MSNTFKEVEEFARGGEIDKIVTLKVATKHRRVVQQNGWPEKVRVRLVKIFLDSGVEVLMNSLLDREQYPPHEIGWVYGRRWGEENFWDRLKNQIEVERWGSGKVALIEQEFQAMLFLVTLESVLCKEEEEEIMREGLERGVKYQYKINKSISYSTVANHIIALI